jgi:hypothetical protein
MHTMKINETVHSRQKLKPHRKKKKVKDSPEEAKISIILIGRSNSSLEEAKFSPD